MRLYPTFWICATITAVFAAILGGAKTSITLADYLASLTMFATVLGYEPVDGVYWTLVYELQFYFAVFLVYLLGGQRWRDTILMVCGAALLILTLMGWPFLPRFEHLQFYGFFVGGAMIAVIYRRGLSIIPLALVVGLCAVAAAQYGAGSHMLKLRGDAAPHDSGGCTPANPRQLLSRRRDLPSLFAALSYRLHGDEPHRNAREQICGPCGHCRADHRAHHNGPIHHRPMD